MGKKPVLYSLFVCLEGDVNEAVRETVICSSSQNMTHRSPYSDRPSSPQLPSLFTFPGPWCVAPSLSTPAALGQSNTRTIIKTESPPAPWRWVSEKAREHSGSPQWPQTVFLPAECGWTPKERDWIRRIIAAVDMESRSVYEIQKFLPFSICTWPDMSSDPPKAERKLICSPQYSGHHCVVGQNAHTHLQVARSLYTRVCIVSVAWFLLLCVLCVLCISSL